ncbi:MAG: LytR/AlgR family response regulator transcription factor [Thermoanaerobaculia bacterium]
MTSIRALIVDDEPLSRQRIRDLLAVHHDVAVIGEAEDGASAIEAMERLKPDVVFLDVQMPGLNGFEVLDDVNADALPTIVFATAFDRYAVEAFRRHAIDYLLKPIEAERLAETVQRLRDKSACTDPAWLRQVREIAGEISGSRYRARLVVKTRERIFFVNTADVHWFEASANYVRLHVQGREHVVRTTMYRLETELDPAMFIRIHRSIIINVAHIAEIQPFFGGGYVALLKSGARVTVQRQYRSRLMQALER